jgi:hypothetical protein
MADARDLTWFDNSKPKQDKRRQRDRSRSGDWGMGDSSPRRWDAGGGGGGDYNPSFPTSAGAPSQQAPSGPGGGGGSMNQEILVHAQLTLIRSAPCRR